MKLYTEEQVKQMIEKSRGTGLTAEYLMLVNTPIELPSDEDIEMATPYVPRAAHDYYVGNRDGFEEGAKWMRDKIQGGEQ